MQLEAHDYQKALADVLRMRRVALDMRREESATWTLSERIAFAHVLETIDHWIAWNRSRLSALGVACARVVA